MDYGKISPEKHEERRGQIENRLHARCCSCCGSSSGGQRCCRDIA